MRLAEHQYGKAKVRVMKVARETERHSLHELEVEVLLHGDFADSFMKADNKLVVATDSIKNIVNILAYDSLDDDIPAFAARVAEHFLEHYTQVMRVRVHIRQRPWNRLTNMVGGHNHAFSVGDHRLLVHLEAKRGEPPVLESGVDDLLVLKTTGSGFANFVQDEFRTLPDTDERILAMRMWAMWRYGRVPQTGSVEINARILQTMLSVFADEYSVSVQATMHDMAEAVFAKIPEIDQIALALPNVHCLRVPLEAFGRENKDTLFVPTDEPHGQIEAVFARE